MTPQGIAGAWDAPSSLARQRQRPRILSSFRMARMSSSNRKLQSKVISKAGHSREPRIGSGGRDPGQRVRTTHCISPEISNPGSPDFQIISSVIPCHCFCPTPRKRGSQQTPMARRDPRPRWSGFRTTPRPGSDPWPNRAASRSLRRPARGGGPECRPTAS